MVVNLPYNLREGQVAYALKVMANFRALLGALNIVNVEGLGEADVGTLLNLLYQSMIKADEDGNAEHILFEDGENLKQKFAAGTLNASILNSEGLFYFHVGADGHLYVTGTDGLEEGDFEINESGHLQFNLDDPASNSNIHVYDLGQVVGDKGDPGADGMLATTYDPNNVGKDLNTYTGYFVCLAANWDDNTYTLTDNDSQHVSGATLAGHITASTGHALVGPAYNTSTDEEVEAWSAAMMRVVSQGNGQIVFKALGDIPEVDIYLQVTMFV